MAKIWRSKPHWELVDSFNEVQSNNDSVAKAVLTAWNVQGSQCARRDLSRWSRWRKHQVICPYFLLCLCFFKNALPLPFHDVDPGRNRAPQALDCYGKRRCRIGLKGMRFRYSEDYWCCRYDFFYLGVICEKIPNENRSGFFRPQYDWECQVSEQMNQWKTFQRGCDLIEQFPVVCENFAMHHSRFVSHNEKLSQDKCFNSRNKEVNWNTVGVWPDAIGLL